MRKLDFMDLKEQTADIREEIFKRLEEVADKTCFSGGEYVLAFERDFEKYLGLQEHTFCGVSSGSDALFLLLKAYGIGEGDEVIVPANTFVATAFAVRRTGARPVFCDCDVNTFEIDPASAKSRITSKTKAVIGVHMYGNAFDADELRKVCERHSLYLFEDSAQAQGTVYKGSNAGTLGDGAGFSFYPSKNLGAWGEAGGVCTDTEHAMLINIMKNQGSDVRYHHGAEGFNMRMDGIQGAVLSVKLRYLDTWNKRRREITEAYREGIRNDQIKFQKITDGCVPAPYLAVVITEDREALKGHLEAGGVSTGIHYPIPCHLQEAFMSLGYKKGDLPISEYVCDHILSLPLYPEMKDEDVSYVIDLCNGY